MFTNLFWTNVSHQPVRKGTNLYCFIQAFYNGVVTRVYTDPIVALLYSPVLTFQNLKEKIIMIHEHPGDPIALIISN